MQKKKIYDVGDEIEALCNKCKDATVHVIEVIKDDEVKKVLCKSCSSSHRYKSPDAKPAPKKKSTAAKEKSTSAAAKTKEQRKRTRVLNKTEEEDYRNYDMAKAYAVNDVVIHNKFGEGVVIEVINPLKVAVAFEDQVRTMIQNYK